MANSKTNKNFTLYVNYDSIMGRICTSIHENTERHLVYMKGIWCDSADSRRVVGTTLYCQVFCTIQSRGASFYPMMTVESNPVPPVILCFEGVSEAQAS